MSTHLVRMPRAQPGVTVLTLGPAHAAPAAASLPWALTVLDKTTWAPEPPPGPLPSIQLSRKMWILLHKVQEVSGRAS